MRRKFYLISFIILSFFSLLSFFFPLVAWSFVLWIPLFLWGLQNAFQKKRAVLRNYPLLGLFRYFFESIRPEIQQYFVESDTDGTPVSREYRSLVYQRAKLEPDTLPFGTQKDVYGMGYEWIHHSIAPAHVDPTSLRVTIGGSECKKPYSASIYNISAMSYGALSKNAILALNAGAQMGEFYHNTGEGGVSPYHLKHGGDLVWQIGTGYFGCRNDDGSFNPDLFQTTAQLENIKMIEIKISQGAKPAHGGLLPAAKITPEVAAIRKVPMGQDVASPPSHKSFSTPSGLLKFIAQLRDLSGGKPIGFKLCVGQPSEFFGICKAMLETGITPDFISVDGSEGGTGAAPLEFSNSVGSPLEESLHLVHTALVGFGLRDKIKIIASGKILNGFHMFSRMALGADLCASSRGMMLALGCIQARTCNKNNCPVGVATTDEELTFGLDPSDKKVRVYNFHKNTVFAFAELLGSVGATEISQIKKTHISRRVSRETYKSYEELFPSIAAKAFLQQDSEEPFATYLRESHSGSFVAHHPHIQALVGASH